MYALLQFPALSRGSCRSPEPLRLFTEGAPAPGSLDWRLRFASPAPVDGSEGAGTPPGEERG
eukprot:2916449-Alexandrium_andersonii.AAC.1